MAFHLIRNNIKDTIVNINIALDIMTQIIQRALRTYMYLSGLDQVRQYELTKAKVS